MKRNILLILAIVVMSVISFVAKRHVSELDLSLLLFVPILTCLISLFNKEVALNSYKTIVGATVGAAFYTLLSYGLDMSVFLSKLIALIEGSFLMLVVVFVYNLLKARNGK